MPLREIAGEPRVGSWRPWSLKSGHRVHSAMVCVRGTDADVQHNLAGLAAGAFITARHIGTPAGGLITPSWPHARKSPWCCPVPRRHDNGAAWPNSNFTRPNSNSNYVTMGLRVTSYISLCLFLPSKKQLCVLPDMSTDSQRRSCTWALRKFNYQVSECLRR